MIENGKPVGVVLTMEEYEKLQNKSETADQKPAIIEPAATHPVGEAIVKEMNFIEASADLTDINLADAADINLEDLGLDELPY